MNTYALFDQLSVDHILGAKFFLSFPSCLVLLMYVRVRNRSYVQSGLLDHLCRKQVCSNVVDLLGKGWSLMWILNSHLGALIPERNTRWAQKIGEWTCFLSTKHTYSHQMVTSDFISPLSHTGPHLVLQLPSNPLISGNPPSSASQNLNKPPPPTPGYTGCCP